MEDKQMKPEQEQGQEQEQEQERYVERPMWQVWGARVGLLVFLLFVVYQIISIAGGGV